VRDLQDAQKVKNAHEKELLSKPGVIGVALGSENGTPVILVMTESRAAQKNIPTSLDGIPVRFRITDKFYPQ
jgi:hypothetical protein